MIWEGCKRFRVCFKNFVPSEIVSDNHLCISPEVTTDEAKSVSANLTDPNGLNPDPGFGIELPDNHRLVQGTRQQPQIVRTKWEKYNWIRHSSFLPGSSSVRHQKFPSSINLEFLPCKWLATEINLRIFPQTKETNKRWYDNYRPRCSKAVLRTTLRRKILT